MPGSYPEYSDTEEGWRTFNFFSNSRTAIFIGFFPAIVAGLWTDERLGTAIGIAAGVITFVVIATAIFWYNIGGRLFRRWGP